MKREVEIIVAQEVTKHEDGDYFEMRIVGDDIDTSVPIDASAGGRFVAMRRAQDVLIANGILPEGFALSVPEGSKPLFPFFNHVDISRDSAPSP